MPYYRFYPGSHQHVQHGEVQAISPIKNCWCMLWATEVLIRLPNQWLLNSFEFNLNPQCPNKF
jgi:hypothetical protein